jgi:hypothetical protein
VSFKSFLCSHTHKMSLSTAALSARTSYMCDSVV